ncbi:general transcription factor IIE subunit 1-like isoform X2 [Lacerta agilis]|uniref:general transcription factor IIE subunit 1-like isoform X2 n=1 Tax=Lacerta agilis TaxID=80427 RepID=UPI00141A2B73|nr:general transcription factor IIE subunit 1-like isoform X2 [Lacerta agilis]
MGGQDVITEVPTALKRLAKYMVRGFYGAEHALALDVLIRYACVKEDDLLLLLRYERKQLRTVLNTLKADKLVKLRVRVETGHNGKSARHTYYYINYKVLVHVAKYKLDHMRRKIEADEQRSTTRSSFKCPACSNAYTDLEVNQLFDAFTGTFRCTYCNTEVEEDVSALPRRDAQTLLAKFNQQTEPIFELLRETEDIVLPYDLLEPQPTEIPELARSLDKNPCSKTELLRCHEKWATRNMYVQNVVIDIQKSGLKKKATVKAVKGQPVWMTQSTTKGTSSAVASTSVDSPKKPSINNEVLRTLLIHESIPFSVSGQTPCSDKNGPQQPESDTSESEEEAKPTAVNATGSDLENDLEPKVLNPTIIVAGRPHLYSEVSENPELVSFMTDEERVAYIKVGQEVFQSIFE